MTHISARNAFWILTTSFVLGIGAWALAGPAGGGTTSAGERVRLERIPVGVLTLHGCVSGVRMGTFEPSTLTIEVGQMVRRFDLREGLDIDDLAVLIQDDFAAQSIRVTTVGTDSLVFGLPHAGADFGIDGNDRTLRCSIELSEF